ncbi:MAG: O-acetylhomoserine aminocarboxypropyltransferase/cysteine synthase [Verrucomicrobiales bacterium]|jgi:O-acetylhomoserine (thiol)-lyase|nr:O-acetylhomoserine aminocarboxypropyltransferase/cysteine synthase [Verrucomicrobiales bacterium]
MSNKSNTQKTIPSPSAARGKGTVCIQGGYTPKVGEPRILPIFQSTTYKYDDLDQVERLFALRETGYKYTRTGNPTLAAFEAKITELEGGTGAVALASGQAANLLAIMNITSAGEHIVAASTIYGGTYTLLDRTLRRYGIETTFVEPEISAKELQAAFRPNTRLVLAETIGNPGLGILDFDKFAAAARRNDVPFIVDNTLATPILCNPFKLGANLITHSATKYIDGHATSLGGVVIDGGNYNWANGKFPDLTEPDVTYAGTRYVEKFGRTAYIAKARAQYLRDFGACLSPVNAFLFNLGLETLHLRMTRHSENALTLAEFLSRHPQVNWVVYPGLKGNPQRARIKKYFLQPQGSGILTFGIKGGARAARAFVKNLRVAALVVHIGDARTSVLHPGTSTHAQLNARQQRSAGITPDMIRVSVGIEDAADLVGDFAQALGKAR